MDVDAEAHIRELPVNCVAGPWHDRRMSDWGRRTYGDPCQECGFSWGLGWDEAVALLADIPGRFRQALAGSDGRARHPGLGWSAGAYVCHVADNLRIWAERLAGAARGSTQRATLYDPDLLATARSYEQLPIEGALWSLERAVGDWLVAGRMAADADVTLTHPERGEQTHLDALLTTVHDAFHHEWDVRRSLGSPP